MRAKQLEESISKFYGIEQGVFYSEDNKKSRQESEALHFLWFFLHSEVQMSYLTIARRYGKSRRNVILAVTKIKCGINTQKYYKEKYDGIILEMKKASSEEEAQEKE